MNVKEGILHIINNLNFSERDFLERYRLYTYFPEKIDSLTNKNIYLAQKSEQKHFSERNFTALKTLTAKFKENDIDFILLKGIPLSYELYQSFDVRESVDIDILLRKKDLSKAYNLFGDLGFALENGEVVTSHTPETDYMLSYGNHHLAPLYGRNENGDPVYLEIHLYPFPKTKYDFDVVDYLPIDVEKLFHEKEEIEINNLVLYQLSLQDRLLNLMIHFATHFLNDSRDYIRGLRPFSLEIRLLYDLATFICLHKKEINWKSLLQKGSGYGFEDDLYLTCHLLNEIWPGLTGISCTERKKKLAYGDYMRKILPELIGIPLSWFLSDRLFSTYQKLLVEMNPNSGEVLPVAYDEMRYESIGKEIIRGERKTIPVGLQHRDGMLLLKLRCNFEATLDKRFMGTAEVFHIKQIPGIYLYFYNKDILSKQEWYVKQYGIIQTSHGIQLIDLIKWGNHEGNTHMVDSKWYSLNIVTKKEKINTIEIGLSGCLIGQDSGRDYQEIGFSLVHSDRIDMYEYFTPDCHDILQIHTNAGKAAYEGKSV